MKTEIHFNCPQCQRPMMGDDELQFVEIACPDCKYKFIPVDKVKHRAPDFKTPKPTVTDTMQTCPSCVKAISRTAEACPHCGHFFATAGRVKLSNPVHLLGLLICIGIIVAVAAYVVYMSGH